jgi:hypothetical protein
MSGTEDALINRISETIAFDYANLNFSERQTLLDMTVKLMEPIIYHVLGSQRSAIGVIDSLAGLIGPENEDRVPPKALKDMMLSAKDDIMISTSWISLPLNTEDCYVTARVPLGPAKVDLYVTYKYSYLDPGGQLIHHRAFSLPGYDLVKWKDIADASCKELKEDYEEGIKFLTGHGARPTDRDLKDTVRERLATVIIKEFHTYDKDSMLQLFHLVDKLTPALTQHIMAAGDRVDWVPKGLGANYVLRGQTEPLVNVIEWALDNMAYTPLIHGNSVLIPVEMKDIRATVTVMTGDTKVIFFAFPKALIVSKSLYPVYTWSCTMTGATNSCGVNDPEAIVNMLGEKIAERMAKEGAELNEARELINEMLSGGGKK